MSRKLPLSTSGIFFDDKLLAEITEQSNLYAIQKNANKALHLTCDELEQFLSTIMYMSIYSLPQSRMYWSRELRVEKVASVMSRDRWQTIKNSLHFNNNDLLEVNAGKDRLFKIRPLTDNLLPKFQVLPKSQMLAVDEQTVPFKGRSSLKQYVPSKPHTWGYNILVLCDVHGLVYDFSIYTGDISALFLDDLTFEQPLMLCSSFRALSQRTRAAYSFLTTGSLPSNCS